MARGAIISGISNNGTEVVVDYTGPFYPADPSQKPGTNPDAMAKAAGLNVSQQNNILRVVVEKPRIMNLVIKAPQHFLVEVFF